MVFRTLGEAVNSLSSIELLVRGQGAIGRTVTAVCPRAVGLGDPTGSLVPDDRRRCWFGLP